MTLHALRQAVGDDDFFTIVREWATANAGENVPTEDFIALAGRISGQELDSFFEEWLFTDVKPPSLEEAAALKAAPGAAELPHRLGALERQARPSR